MSILIRPPQKVKKAKKEGTKDLTPKQMAI